MERRSLARPCPAPFRGEATAYRTIYAFIGREAAPEDPIIPWIIKAAVSVMDTAATTAL